MYLRNKQESVMLKLATFLKTMSCWKRMRKTREPFFLTLSL